MFEGKNIHYSRVDNKPLCSFSVKICKQRRLNGFGFCVRHILEDPTAPFLQCAHECKHTQQRCTYPVSKSKQEGYCSAHMQVLGIKPRKSRERTNKQKAGMDGKMSINQRLKGRLNLLQRNKPVTEDAHHNPEDPYAFPDVPDGEPPAATKPANQSPAHATAAPCPEVVAPSVNHKSPSEGVSTMAKLYPELVEKLERTKFKCEAKPKGSAKTSRTLSRLQNKIAQNKIKDKLKKTQVDVSDVTTPESCHTPVSQPPSGIPQFNTALQNLALSAQLETSPQHQTVGGAAQYTSSPQLASTGSTQFIDSPLPHLTGSTQNPSSGNPMCVSVSPHYIAATQRQALELFSADMALKAQLNSDAKMSSSILPTLPPSVSGRLEQNHPITMVTPSPQQQHVTGLSHLQSHLGPFPYLHQHVLQQYASQQQQLQQQQQQKQALQQPSLSTMTPQPSSQPPPPPPAPPSYPLKVETRQPPLYTPPASLPTKIPVVHTRPKRPRNMLTETEARRKLRTKSAVKVYAYYASQRLHARDLLSYGVDSSDNDCSDVDDLLTRQQEWFMPSSDEESMFDDQDEEDLFMQRRTKQALLRSRIRRQFSQLRKAQRNNKAPHSYQARALQALVESVRENPLAAVSVIREIHQEIKTTTGKKRRQRTQERDRPRPCLHKNDDGESCSSLALPSTNHCLKHILYNVDQQVFAFCTAKFADNTQCCVPVFDIRHELPLCMEHAAKADNYNKNQNPEAKPKKPRKKTKPSALTRPPKKGKKRKNQRKNLRPQKPIPPSEPVGDAGFSSATLNSVDEEVDMDQSSSDLPAESSTQATAQAMDQDLETVKPLEVNTADLSSDLGVQLSPGTLDKTFGDITMDNEQTKFLDEHDLHEVLNKLPEEAFDIFAGNKSVKIPDEAFDILVGKNGEFLPTREETEELERVLAAASKEVTDCQESLKNFSQVSDMNLIEENSNDDEITKQIADSILNETLSPGHLGGTMPDDLHHDNLTDITNSISANELKSFSQVLQTTGSLLNTGLHNETMTYTSPQGQIQGHLLTGQMLQGVVIPQGHLQLQMNQLLGSAVSSSPQTAAAAGIMNTLSAQLNSVQAQLGFHSNSAQSLAGQGGSGGTVAQRLTQPSSSSQPSTLNSASTSALTTPINSARQVWTTNINPQVAERIVTPITFNNGFPVNTAATFPQNLPGVATKYATFSPQLFPSSDFKPQDGLYQVKPSSTANTLSQQATVLSSSQTINGQPVTSQTLTSLQNSLAQAATALVQPQKLGQPQILAQTQQIAQAQKDT